MRFGIAPLNWLSDPTLATIAICIAIVWKSSSFMALMLLAGLQTIPRSLYEAAEVDGATDLAAVRRDHAADAAAGDLRRADLPHDHRDPDLRHPVRDDRRRPGRCDRDARDVHPQDDARLPRLRLRLGARGADVPVLDGGDVGLPQVHAAQRGTEDCAANGSLRTSSKRTRRLAVAAIVVAVNGFFPAVWILLTSLKTETELIRSPITYLPDAPTLDNYVTAFTDAADPALHVEQPRRGRPVDRAVRASSARSPPTR